MLTGYLYVDKPQAKWNRIIDLIITTIFWCIVITITCLVFFKGTITSIKDLAISLFPPFKDRYWYIVSYVFVYFMIPYLNIFIQTLNKQAYKKFLIIILLLTSVAQTFLRTDLFRLNNGSSALWLCICYLIGAYIRKYEDDFVSNKSKWIKILVVSSIFIDIWWNVVEYLFIKFTGKAHLGTFFMNGYYSLLVVLMSISILVIALSIKPNTNKYDKLILSLSKGMFGVYIIHAHCVLWDEVIQVYLKNIWKIIITYNPLLTFLVTLLGILIIVIVTYILEMIRQYLFKILKINDLLGNLSHKLDDKLPLKV